MSANVVAFDLSLTCTGWADATGCGVLVPPASADRGTARLRWIRAAVLARVPADALVVLEGYSFASRGRAIISLGELGGVVRCALADAGHPYVDVPPSCRAMYATGKGNAAKAQVLAEAVRTLGYAGHSYDEADALWLYRMGMAHYAAYAREMIAGKWLLNGESIKVDTRGGVLTAKQRKALDGVTWPEAVPSTARTPDFPGITSLTSGYAQ